MKKLLNIVLLKKIVPWVVAAAMFAYLFVKYPPGEAMQILHIANLPFFLIFAVVYFLYVWWVDCIGMAKIFTRFGYPTKWRELMAVRSATYLFMIFNYGAAQGGLAYFFQKKKQVPFFKSAGLFLFMIIIDLYWVIFAAAVGSYFCELEIGGVDIPSVTRVVTLISTAFIVLNFIFWKVHIPVKLFTWLKGRDIFQTFSEARISDYLFAFLMRLPIHLGIISGMYVVAITCNAYIPFTKILAFVPIILLIGVIPITPGGLGATQIATIELFKDVVRMPFIVTHPIMPEEFLLGMGILWLMANYLLKVLFGLFYLRRISQEDYFPKDKKV